MFKRVFSLILALVLFAAPLLSGAGTVSAAQITEEELVEKQIRAFGDSIDQADAVDKAASALAKHGVMGRGKKLSIGKSHALTSILWGSELMQTSIATGCIRGIESLRELDFDSIYVEEMLYWGSFEYLYMIYPYEKGENKYLIHQSPKYAVDQSPNTYDDALKWMAGAVNVDIYISRDGVSGNNEIYTVTVRARDIFDFDRDPGSISKELLALLGSALFRSFTWHSTVTFQLKVPNSCTHQNGNGFVDSIISPTCTTDGYTTYTCSHCGYSYQADKVKAKGHNFGEWSVTIQPTCTEPGEEQRSCKTCKEVETREAAAKGHDYSAEVKEPTCTEPGYTTYTCPCGDSYVGDDTAPLGHSFEDRICTACGKVEDAPGDTDLDNDVDVDDVLALLWHVLFPEEYPLN